MSVYKDLQSENRELKESLLEVQEDLDLLVDYLRYGPEWVSRHEVIMRLGWIDLPPLTD